MRNSIRFPVDDTFTDRLILWLERQTTGICFRGEGWNFAGDVLAGFGQLRSVTSDQPADVINFCEETDDFVFSHLNYDVKNALEELASDNSDACDFPLFSCFIPEIVITVRNQEVAFHYYPQIQSAGHIQSIFHAILDVSPSKCATASLPERAEIDEKTYLQDLRSIQQAIQDGEVYQANYCQAFNWSSVNLSGAKLFNEGFHAFPNPFSVYYKVHAKELLCFSPERFIKIENGTITSQPMKGTAPRGANKMEDELLKAELASSEKDRRENVMIVDMVRNDLSHYAQKGSVKVPELYRIQSYPKVHQMYSTITAELKPGTPLMAALLKAFPMGSMTGAPKVRAMQLLETLEHTKRGIYSGTVGFILPDRRADFNVVIRSLVYNRTKQVMTCQAGGGITALSSPEAEYEESLVKVRPLFELVNSHVERSNLAMLPLTDESTVD